MLRMGEVLDFGKHFEKRRKEKEAAGSKPVDGIIHQDNVVSYPEENIKIDHTEKVSEKVITDEEAYDVAKDVVIQYGDREKLYAFFLESQSKKDSPESHKEFEAVHFAKIDMLKRWTDDQLKADLHEYKESLESNSEELHTDRDGGEIKNREPKFNMIHIASIAQEYYLRKYQEFDGLDGFDGK